MYELIKIAHENGIYTSMGFNETIKNKDVINEKNSSNLFDKIKEKLIKNIKMNKRL